MQKNSVQAAKIFISNAAKHVPGNHFYITDVKLAMSEMIGQEFRGGIADVSEEELLLKIKVCKELLSLAEILAPAENRIRGSLFFEIHSAIAELGQRRGSQGHEGPDYLLESLTVKLIVFRKILSLIVYLQESKKYLVQAIEALKHESPVMPEGKILEQAKINLRDINVLLATVRVTVGATPA